MNTFLLLAVTFLALFCGSAFSRAEGPDDEYVRIYNLIQQADAVDPRELAKAEEKIKSLRKEVEVLTVNLKRAEAKPDKPINPAAFDQTKQGLAAANQKLTQQMQVLASLTLERDALQRRLQT